MRIISGTLGGRKIHPPAKMPATRPTTDIAKEGLFNTLQNLVTIEGLKTLDIFGGTGSISYELASRGATDLTLVERDRKMAAFIRQTAAAFRLTHLKVLQMDVFQYLRQCPEQFDLIFAGPPYALQEIDQLPTIIFRQKLLRPGGLFILEHTPRNNYEGVSQFEKVKNYGTTLFSMFRENS